LGLSIYIIANEFAFQDSLDRELVREKEVRHESTLQRQHLRQDYEDFEL
jgi:hypothetical protein